MDQRPHFCPETSYHVFNRANGSERIFIEEENYHYFLSKFKEYILPIADVYAYNLLPNHFHFLIRIKNEENLKKHYVHLHKKMPSGTYNNWINNFIIQQFSNFLNSYAKSFNFKYNRRGSLFMSNLKKVTIDSNEQFTATIFYVHKNAVHHGLCKKIEDWPYNSYHAIISDKPTLLLREEVIEWYGSVEKYIEYHQQPIHLKNARIIE